MNPFDRYTWVDVALGLLGGLRGELKASFDGVAELCPTENYVKKSAMRKEIQKFLSKSGWRIKVMPLSRIFPRP